MHENEASLPSIVFKVKGQYYSVNSRHVETIMPLPAYQELPIAPPCVTGFFLYRGAAVPMLNLRMLFGSKTLKQECEEFCDMIDERKQDHIHWVNELRRSIEGEYPFTLATDPHQCAFGRWYDNFVTKNTEILFHMRKIEEPHRMLHEAALDVMRCSQDCEHCSREECLKSILDRVEKEKMPVILQLLDETKELFRGNIYREMVLVINSGNGVGLVVDEVLAVEDLEEIGDTAEILQSSPYIASIKKSAKVTEPILELDVPMVAGEPAIGSISGVESALSM